MSAAASSPAVSLESDKMRRRSGEDLHVQLQKQRVEQRFAEIQAQRRQAHAVRREAEQKARNRETDQQILLLMQADERLASLLSQAADSMQALLPSSSVSSNEAQGFRYGAKAFEAQAQHWFSILNEVQYSLRTAVRHLRDAQLAPLTQPVGPEARLTGRAGSASPGHTASLLEAFVDMSGSDGRTFKIPTSSSSSSGSRTPLSPLPESHLSLQALREREYNWKQLSRSLKEVNDSLQPSQSDAPLEAKSIEDALITEALTSRSGTDKLLLNALVNANGLAN